MLDRRPPRRYSSFVRRPPDEEIRIANRATYWPVAPMDLLIATPVVTRALFGVTPLGRLVKAAAVGLYVGSALRDWRDRRRIRRVAFLREFGTDGRHLTPMPRERREAEVAALAERLNDGLVLARPSRRELAIEVEERLTGYIASITGQRVRSSAEVRSFGLVSLAFPSALGACDILTGDVALFRDAGLFEPHIIAHEFSHRKGYWKELDAQVLAYLTLVQSGEPRLVQSALLERLYRNLRVLAHGDEAAFDRLAGRAALRPELEATLRRLRPPSSAVGRGLDAGMRRVYDARMRATGQNGLSDYDLGFTNFLYTFETSRIARQAPPAIAVHAPSRA
jgi:hypothetical protein